MGETAQSQKSKGSHNTTTSVHRKERYALYKSQIYAKHKLRRILKSCGVGEAKKWARSHLAESVLLRLMKG
jgi:hypothetical protein